MNKTVIITGASSGIGQQVAYILAKFSHNLVITYNTNLAGGQKTKEQCLKIGAHQVELLHLNLNDEPSIIKFSNMVKERFKKIDVLINNAGHAYSGRLTDQTVEQINLQMNTNLVGLIKITKFLLPAVKEKIVNIGSTLSFIPKGKLSIYCASKFGLRGFTSALALSEPRLQIYQVNPPLTNTAMGSEDGADPKKVAQVIVNVVADIYKLRSGAQVNYQDYKCGKFFTPIIKVLRKIKNL